MIHNDSGHWILRTNVAVIMTVIVVLVFVCAGIQNVSTK